MRLEYQIVAAILLDHLLGDPAWFPHPVRLIGGFAAGCETFFRKLSTPRLAGILSVITVILLTGIVVAALLKISSQIHPLAENAVTIFLLYTGIAAKDLARHSRRVYQALQENNIVKARQRVAMIVGRDTENMDQEAIAQAAVESVAENMVDGITAPLVFAFIGGPLGIMLYKAVNTMDSMFGYKNERYEQFGWVAARLDDLANFIPARLTALLVPIAAAFLRLDHKNAWRILWRDRLNHTSPNSGHTEAAVAGALGIQLGGPNMYFGKIVDKPAIGEAKTSITSRHILSANRLMLVTTMLTLSTLLVARLVMLSFNGQI